MLMLIAHISVGESNALPRPGVGDVAAFIPSQHLFGEGALDDRLGPTVGSSDHAERASRYAGAAERKIICDAAER